MAARNTASNGLRNSNMSRRGERSAWSAAACSPGSRDSRDRYPNAGGPAKDPSQPKSNPVYEPHAPAEAPPDPPRIPSMPEHLPIGDPPQKRGGGGSIGLDMGAFQRFRC